MRRRRTIYDNAARVAGQVQATETCLQPDDPGRRRAFARELERLPEEEPYAYHRRLIEEPVHRPRRARAAAARPGELAVAEQGWKLVWGPGGSAVLRGAVADFRDFLQVSMGVRVEVEERPAPGDGHDLARAIVVGTRDQLPGVGAALRGAKDYRLAAGPERVTVCGYDDLGVMHGLYNLESRLGLRQGPFLPAALDTVRHSLFRARMVQSWLGWMEFPDRLLSHLAHAGFDAVYASAMANPNGDRTTAESSTDFYARLLHRIRRQDPARMRDLIDRAAAFGIGVYAPIIHQHLGTPASEAELRRLVRDIVARFPDIRGYVLLTEGFWYRTWGGGHGASEEYVRDWADHWCRAVGIVAEECHRVDPRIEVLPWEYNIDFRPQNEAMKRYFVRRLPADTIPLLTWENGKAFSLDGLSGHLRDYAISQVGPAEVTAAQIEEARARRLPVYVNADTFVCGAQLQTVPFHPFPYQWVERYEAMERWGVCGTMESWTTGFSPSFVTELRAWYCWTDRPPLDELLRGLGERDFGAGQGATVSTAWRALSEAVRLVPDTGPTMGTSGAVGNPLFLEEPPPRTATFDHSWTDQAAWTGYLGAELNPYWPYTVSRLVFVPDFAGGADRPEQYARAVSGIETAGERPVLPVFLKYLRLAAERMEEGLVPYRAAALASSPEQRAEAVRQVAVAEQLQRMLESCHAVLAFEDLRRRLAAETDAGRKGGLLDRMEVILRDERARTELSLLAATRDARLGFQCECDYVYTPYSLRQKLASLQETLEIHLARRRARIAAPPAAVAAAGRPSAPA